MGQVILSDRVHLPVDLDVPTGQASAVRLAYSSVTTVFTIPEAELS
jgi:hypothetical protein